MLIFGTDLEEVEKTKCFLSSKFSMTNIEEADVILGIKIIRNNDGIILSQSHYIEKVLGRFNYKDCSLVATPLDPTYKVTRNSGRSIAQLEYAKVIGCLMYATTSTRLDIAFAVVKLSRYTSNLSKFYWHAICQVLMYLKKTQDYGLSYLGYPSVIERY